MISRQKYSLLNGSNLWTMVYWLLFKRYKIVIMMYWEEKGMVDLFAFKKSQETTRKEYLELKSQGIFDFERLKKISNGK